jgi:prepilin-type N-terminal cleavage/methylation domain-containing protein
MKGTRMQRLRTTPARRTGDAGVTLVELMMTILIFGIVMIVINNVFFTTNRLYGTTTVRAGQQMNARAGLALMVTELRTAGCDPTERSGAGMITASGDSVHVTSDYNGDDVISTAEPSENILYYYDPNLLAVVRDPGTGPQIMIANVTACAFSYFDVNNNPIALPMTADDMDLIRSIGVTITTTTDRGGVVTADTRVGLRNG